MALPLIVATLLLAAVVVSLKWPHLGYASRCNRDEKLDEQDEKQEV